MRTIPAGVEWQRIRGNVSIATVRQEPEVIYELGDIMPRGNPLRPANANEIALLNEILSRRGGEPMSVSEILFGRGLWI